ncbi:hypothetical protein ACM66B_005943 [Microbotryomycetes sp. NB124-2]
MTRRIVSRASTPAAAVVAVVLASASPVNAQYYGYYDNRTSYGARIGIGIGVAVGVALIILLIGYLMRRKRARQFKQAFPVQQGFYNPQQQSYGQQHPPQQQQYGQYSNNNQFNGANQAEMGQAPPPTYSGYRQDSSSGQQDAPYYPPPQSPPPVANPQQAYYSPPPGPPPSNNK